MTYLATEDDAHRLGLDELSTLAPTTIPVDEPYRMNVDLGGVVLPLLVVRRDSAERLVVLNNGGIYRGDFENLGADGDPSPLTLTYNAHYEKVLEAFGGKGYYATTPEEVERMVGEAVESGKPSFVHVQIAQYAGKESGNIGALNPKPVVGALVDSEVTMYDYATGARM